MPRALSLQTNFTGGEIGDGLDHRADLDLYGQALAQARNVEIQPQGGVRRRPGTQDIGPVRALLGALDLGNAEVTFGYQLSGITNPDPDPDPDPDPPIWDPNTGQWWQP